jgi:hypothetical protein
MVTVGSDSLENPAESVQPHTCVSIPVSRRQRANISAHSSLSPDIVTLSISEASSRTLSSHPSRRQRGLCPTMISGRSCSYHTSPNSEILCARFPRLESVSRKLAIGPLPQPAPDPSGSRGMLNLQCINSASCFPTSPDVLR